MKEKVELSVIIPCYNVEQYLVKTVESVVKNIPCSTEIILVEDCSTDNTKKICKELSERFDNIKVVEHKANKGLEETRNDGMSVAEGTWIFFLDGDDLVDEKFTGINSDADVCLYNFKVFDNDNIRNCFCELQNDKKYTRKEFIKTIGEKIQWEMLSCVGNKVYRRKFIVDNNLKFKKKYKYNEDAGFFFEALSKI